MTMTTARETTARSSDRARGDARASSTVEVVEVVVVEVVEV